MKRFFPSSKLAISKVPIVAAITLIVASVLIGAIALKNHAPTTATEIPTFAPETPTFAPETPTFAPETPTFAPETPTPTPVPIDWKLVDLVQAVLEELVDPTFSGDGLEEMDVTLKSKSNDPLEVTIEPGTIFQAQFAGVQDMIVIKEKKFYLESYDDVVSEIIDVACACMELDMPQGTDVFTVSSIPTEEDLVRLLNLPGFADETFRVKQFAIWTITDNPPRDGYVGIGYFGFGSGPSDEEMSRIRVLFEAAEISTDKYQALS